MQTDPKQLADLREEMRRNLEAIERVERLLASKNQSPAPDERQLALTDNDNASAEIADPDDDDAMAPSDSIRGTIERTLAADPNVRWTAQKMLTHLRDIKYPLKAKQPIYTVGQSLKILYNKNRIRMVSRGSGSAPNVYKGKLEATATKSSNEETRLFTN